MGHHIYIDIRLMKFTKGATFPRYTYREFLNITDESEIQSLNQYMRSELRTSHPSCININRFPTTGEVSSLSTNPQVVCHMQERPNRSQETLSSISLFFSQQLSINVEVHRHYPAYNRYSLWSYSRRPWRSDHRQTSGHRISERTHWGRFRNSGTEIKMAKIIN